MAKKKKKKKGGTKLGAAFRKIKAIFNLTAGVQGSATLPGVSVEGKMLNALARHTGVYAHPSYTAFDVNRAIPTWEAIGTEMFIQYVDGRTRHFGNISRHKLLDIAEELMPIVIAHTDGGLATDYGTGFARSYHKQTQGYDMSAGQYGDWDLSRVNPYAAVKIARIVGNALGFIPWVNKRLPKGINL